MGNKKPGALSYTRPLVVAGVGEPLARRSQTSNLDLVNDLAEVDDFLEK